MGGIRLYRDAVALITGAGSGIGRALAVEFARRGATVDLSDVDEPGLAATADLVRQSGGRASTCAVDVRDAAAVDTWVAGAFARDGRVDFLLNNAGIGGTAGLTDRYGPEGWSRVLDINLRGVIHGVHAAYPRMARQGFGHIVNTASIAGLLPFPLALPYCATKHAVVGLSKSLRVEAARCGVRVSALCPGVIRTPILTRSKFIGAEGVSDERILSWWGRLRPIDAEPFAREVLDGVANNRGVIIVPRSMRIVVALCRLFPRFEERFVINDFASTMRMIPELESAPQVLSGAPAPTVAKAP